MAALAPNAVLMTSEPERVGRRSRATAQLAPTTCGHEKERSQNAAHDPRTRWGCGECNYNQ